MSRRFATMFFCLLAAILVGCAASGEPPVGTETTAATLPAPPTAAPGAIDPPATADPASRAPDTAEALAPAVGPDLVQFYGLSPTGRYLAYIRHTPEDLEVNPQVPPSTLHIRDLQNGSDCAFDRALFTMGASWRPRLSWRANDSFVLIDDGGGLWGGGPCPADLIPLSLGIPNGARTFAAMDPARDQFLLRGEDSYFLLRLSAEMGVTPLPAAVPYGDWHSFAFSPDGAHLALHLDSGGGLIVNLETMTVVAALQAAPISGLGDMPEPLWLNERQVMLRSNPDSGPALLDTAGGAGSLLFAGLEDGRQVFLLDAVDLGTEVIVLVRLQDETFAPELEEIALFGSADLTAGGTSGEGGTSGVGGTSGEGGTSGKGGTLGVGETLGVGGTLGVGETLQVGGTLAVGETLGVDGTLTKKDTFPAANQAGLSSDGRDVVWTRAAEGGFEMVVRPVSGGPETVLWLGQEYMRWAYAPDGTLAAVNNDRLRLFQASQLLGEWRLGGFPYGGYPLQWSADGSTLVIGAGFSGRADQGLFVLAHEE